MKKFLILAIIYLVYMGLGLPEGIHGIAWPVMGVYMELPLEFLGALTSLVFLLSAVSSSLSGRIILKVGYGRIVFVSVLLTSIGLFGIAFSYNFVWLLLFIIPLGLGQGATDASINSFVANNYSSRYMSWLHGFWGVGATMGTVIMTQTIAQISWRSGYMVLAALQLVLAGIVIVSVLKDFWNIKSCSKAPLIPAKIKLKTLGLFQKRFQLICLFCLFQDDSPLNQHSDQL